MKKKVSTICKIISVVLMIAFIVFSIADYNNYNPISTSAPFYANILIRAVEFVLPAFVLACIGYFVKRKRKKI